MLSDLANSPESKNDIGTLYLQVLGRPVDSGGLTGWIAQEIAGLSLATVRTDIANSPEAQNDIGAIYLQVLGRAVDSGGLSGWAGLLAGGLTLANVRTDIATSQEAKNDLSSIFTNVIGRAPDTAELAGLETYLGNTPGSTQGNVQTMLEQSGPFGYTTAAAPSGNGTLTATAGPEVFDFASGTFGQDTITGFNAGLDTINLAQALAGNFATLQQHTTTTADGSALITLDPSHSIALSGVAPSSLTAPNFRFV